MEGRVVSKELYYCLEDLIKLEGRDSLIRKHAYKKYSSKTGWATERYKPLNDLSLDDLADLLYNGYQLEETKEERLLSIYKSAKKYDNIKYNKDFVTITKEILNILEIEIEGINK